MIDDREIRDARDLPKAVLIKAKNYWQGSGSKGEQQLLRTYFDEISKQGPIFNKIQILSGLFSGGWKFDLSHPGLQLRMLARNFNPYTDQSSLANWVDELVIPNELILVFKELFTRADEESPDRRAAAKYTLVAAFILATAEVAIEPLGVDSSEAKLILKEVLDLLTPQGGTSHGTVYPELVQSKVKDLDNAIAKLAF